MSASQSEPRSGQILGAIGEFERELIRTRTDEGHKRAMGRGVKFGRKPKLSRFQIAEALARREAGEALTEIGRSYNVSHSTISRLQASDEARRQGTRTQRGLHCRVSNLLARHAIMEVPSGIPRRQL
jgi:DNA invertase Pin-like site-specific DNA recombinase